MNIGLLVVIWLCSYSASLIIQPFYSTTNSFTSSNALDIASSFFWILFVLVFFFFCLLLNFAAGSVKRSVNIWVRGKKCLATAVAALSAIRTNTTQLLTHACHPGNTILYQVKEPHWLNQLEPVNIYRSSMWKHQHPSGFSWEDPD